MTTNLNTAPDTLLSAMVYVWWQRNAGELTTPQANRLLDHMRAMCKRGEVEAAMAGLLGLRRRPWRAPAAVLAAQVSAESGDAERSLRIVDEVARDLDPYWAARARDLLRAAPPAVLQAWRQRIEGEIARCSVHRDSDGDFVLEVGFGFRSPQTGAWIEGRDSQIRNDLKDEPLPPPGTAVHVLYRDDETFMAL